MILAQAGPVVHEVIVQSSTPWHVYVAAVITGLIACIGWYVVHRTSQNRDRLNWRRTALLQSVTSLIEASNNRNEILHTKDALRSELRNQYYRMQVAYDQIRICGSNEIFTLATRVVKLHLDSEDSVTAYQRWIVDQAPSKETEVGMASSYAGINSRQLFAYHQTLISGVQIELKLASRKDALKFPWPDDIEKRRMEKEQVVK